MMPAVLGVITIAWALKPAKPHSMTNSEAIVVLVIFFDTNMVTLLKLLFLKFSRNSKQTTAWLIIIQAIFMPILQIIRNGLLFNAFYFPSPQPGDARASSV